MRRELEREGGGKWIENETSGNDSMILSSFKEDGYVKLNSAWQTVLSSSQEEEEEVVEPIFRTTILLRFFSLVYE